MTRKAEIARFLQTEFSQSKCIVEAVGHQAATVRHKVGHDELRPGGTVSGPVMMALADTAIYIAILGEIGLVTLTVTASFNINFLRKPSRDRDLIGISKLIKVGKSLAVGEVTIYSEGIDQPVAHAVGTYSIPRG